MPHSLIALWSRAPVSSGCAQLVVRETQRRGVLVPALLGELEIPLGSRGIQAAHFERWVAGIEDLASQHIVQAFAGGIRYPAQPPSPKGDSGNTLRTVEIEDKALRLMRIGMAPGKETKRTIARIFALRAKPRVGRLLA